MRELLGMTPARRARGKTERLVSLAEGQGGVIHRNQLLAAGVSGSTISRWEAAGRLHRLYESVYAIGHRAIAEQGKLYAGLLFVGPDAVLSHSTAASWWRLLDVESRIIHLSAPGQRSSVADLVIHHPRELERVQHRGLPVTPVARTLVDIASLVPFSRLRRALAQAEFLRLADLDAVERVTRRGRTGSRALGRALALHRPELARTLSELEERFLELCDKHAIPLPEVNVMVCGLMVDALWRVQRVIVELDGRAAHGTAAAIERDHGRDLTLRTAGYVVLRYTWGQVTREERSVARDVRVSLGLN
jgi:hypothetical protein